MKVRKQSGPMRSRIEDRNAKMYTLDPDMYPYDINIFSSASFFESLTCI